MKRNIGKILAVMSGKGGVGKSFVSSLLAVNLRREGYKVGILDADITGPSIPKIFGVNQKRARADKETLHPVETVTKIKVMSLNLLIDEENKPVIWRGPMISGVVKQFYDNTEWGDLDYLIIDLPPGTSDVTLTVMQSIPVDYMVVVTSPQDLVNLIVEKSIHMSKKMNIPILGIVENMSYGLCPECNKKINLFGESKAKKVAKEMDLDLLVQLPINPKLTQLCDEGRIEYFNNQLTEFTSLGESVLERI
ncbi:Mrp/NBP35 family ATP-binding protein [Thermohalobacter berrensis]|uniref:Iron-sulfur cluster carrier protein n=1 Tax=Thermohalobacter berrensis TaxID=99594 RepID=A0A419T9V5_9FIRM|nr:Mrp/NBP35 family ATP-binding protein [Thermohalobacter berrensis]RKD34259.1 ATP-binding protein [Thermohalobacter berrensis]